MTLPLTTTTVTVLRPPSDVDGLEAPEYTVVVERVAARVAGASASGSHAVGGRQETSSARLYVDRNVDLRRQDRIVDDATGAVWEVTGVKTRTGLGLDHTAAALQSSRGSG